MAVPGCTWLHLAVLGCTWLFLAAPGCTWLYYAVLGCTRLYLAVPGCTRLYMAVLGYTRSGLVSIEGFKDVWNNQTYMSMDGWMDGIGLDGISPDRSISRSPSGDNNKLEMRNNLCSFWLCQCLNRTGPSFEFDIFA